MWIKPTTDTTFRSRRRAASVPADVGIRVSGYDVGGGVASNKARVIANYANEDGNAIAAASRRNDREFLYEISAKMANVNANPPLRPSSSRSVSPNVRRRPPLPVTVATTPASSYLRRAAALTPDDNYEIDAYLQRSPSSPYTSSSLGGYRPVVTSRAVSLPPASLQQSSRPSVPRWFPTSTSYYGRAVAPPSRTVYRGGAGTVPLPVGLPPNLPSGERLDAITDSVIGVAHTSLYGDIVIGIPYKKRYMYNVQREFDDLDTQSLPATNLPVETRVSVAPRFAKTRPASIAIPSGAPAGLVKPYSRVSYAGPSSSGLGPGYRPLAHRGGGGVYPSVTSSAAAADLDDVISIKSYPGAFVGGRSVARTTRRPLAGLDDLENDVDLLDFDDSGAYNQLSSLKKDAKSILNRYSLPPAPAVTSNGPKYLTSNELDQKYGQILSSMQAKNRVTPRADSAPVQLPPYPSTPKKPPISDTRRKLRELLCRSRNDPSYFD